MSKRLTDTRKAEWEQVVLDGMSRAQAEKHCAERWGVPRREVRAIVDLVRADWAMASASLDRSALRDEYRERLMAAFARCRALLDAGDAAAGNACVRILALLATFDGLVAARPEAEGNTRLPLGFKSEAEAQEYLVTSLREAGYTISPPAKDSPS
jgi:hypothetical protein